MNQPKRLFKTFLIIILLILGVEFFKTVRLTFANTSLPVGEFIIDGQDVPGLAPKTPPASQQSVAASPPNFVPGNCVVSTFPETIRQWCDYIEAAAQKYELDSKLIAAIMLMESGGDAQAYSKDGAVGLLQVMPKDGLAAGFMCINGPCFATRPSSQELFEPQFNIDYGTKMLSGLIKKHGSVREALFRYGPSGVGYDYADKVLNIHTSY